MTSSRVPADTSHPLWQFVFFILLWQAMYRVSNAAITALLKILNVFIREVGTAYASLSLHQVFDNVPLNTDAANHFLWSSKEHESFVAYVVCPACDSVYEYEDCIITRGTTKESKRCKHIPYPNHPHMSTRKECGACTCNIGLHLLQWNERLVE